MLMLLSWAVGLAVLVLLVPALVLFLQVEAARRAPPNRPAALTPQALAGRAPLAVILPAHNEAAVIESTLRSVLPQLRPDDVLWVVADNCSDDTAALARACGPQVQVTERHHATLRGKSYALAHGVATMRAHTPRDWVVFIDADCQLGPEALDRLALASQASGRPVQALYLMNPPALPPGHTHGWRQHLATFAWRVRNWVRPRGGHALGWPCQLMGTGMALPAGLLQEELLTNGHITEDMKLGIDLALTGTPPLFLEDALVTSEFPTSSAATRTQRTRWEHGHLDMLFNAAPTLWRAGVRTRQRALTGMALDLCVPPLALLTGLLGLGWMLALGVACLGGGLLPLLLASLGCAGLVLAVTRAWQGWGREVMPGRELLMVPLLILAKVPLYLGFVLKRQTRWVRTDRR